MQCFSSSVPLLRLLPLAVSLTLTWSLSFAGSTSDVKAEPSQAQLTEDLEDSQDLTPVDLPAGIKVLRDVPYGKDKRQCMDVYLPLKADNAPVIFMVHGGGWRFGDKNAKAVVQNKVDRWVSLGFVFISVNYRLLPDADPLDQTQDIAAALAEAQDQAPTWGANPTKFILMGHSAGAHLTALLSANPALALKAGARPWLGTIALDSAALDVLEIMENKHLRLYDRAFGTTPAFWKEASPIHQMTRSAPPMLLVCSIRRDDSCTQASRLAIRAEFLGTKAEVLKQDLSHRDINQKLGESGEFTDAVDSFMASLDEDVRELLE